MPSGAITLTRAQLLAFRLARKESVVVSGGASSGKTLLASALAAQAERSGLECLLVGASPQLDRPIAFKIPNGCPTLLLQRAQQGSRALPDSSDHLPARARIAPEALRDAQVVLRRAVHVRRRYHLSPEDLDLLYPLSPEAADLLTVTMEDAGRIADALWSGNKRAGRSISEVLTVLAGRETEIPPDEHPAYLLSADDETFETGTRPVPEQYSDEAAFAAVLADLRNTAPPERTVIEVYRHFERMHQALNDAADLARKHESLEVAVAANPGDDGAKILDIFARNRPGQDVKAAVSTFERARGHYERDAKALSPYLPRFGFRTVQSFAAGLNSTAKPAVSAEVAQKIRIARPSVRQLPGLLSRLQRVLPKELVAKMVGGPIEYALSGLSSLQSSDPRVAAAAELRELRKLFAGTGFGDLFSTPETFLDFRLSSRPLAALPAYDPEFLDLLLEVDAGRGAVEDYNSAAWSDGIVRARTVEDLASLSTTSRRFAVVVVDDAERYDADLLARLAAEDSCVHRIGVEGAAIHLDASSNGADGGSIAMRLAAAADVGIVCREVPESELVSLALGADRLAAHLSAAGYTSTTADDQVVEIRVVPEEVADEERLQASAAGVGVVVLCRKRRPLATKHRALEGDAHTALSFGWRVAQCFTDGTLLEKDDRYVAMVEEPEVITPSDDLVVDLVRRLQDRGWKPVVAWRNAPRDTAILGTLLEARAVALDRRDAVRDIVYSFDLTSSPDGPGGLPDLERASVPTPPETGSAQIPVISEPAQGTVLEAGQEPITAETSEVGEAVEDVSDDCVSTEVSPDEMPENEIPGDLVHVRAFQREPLVLPAEAVSDEEALDAANRLLFDHLRSKSMARFFSHITFGTKADYRLIKALGEVVRDEQKRHNLAARSYVDAFETVSGRYPVLVLWVMSAAVTDQYATSSEKDVWQHAFKAIGLSGAEVGPFTSQIISPRISAITRSYGFDCATNEGYRHCMKLFLCGGVPRSQLSVLVSAFVTTARKNGLPGSGNLDNWTQDAAAAIPSGYARLRRILRHPEAAIYADTFRRLQEGALPASPVEEAFKAAIAAEESSPPREPGTVVYVDAFRGRSRAAEEDDHAAPRPFVSREQTIDPPTIRWHNGFRVASSGCAIEVLGQEGVHRSLWPDDEATIDARLAFDGFQWRVQGTNMLGRLPGLAADQPFFVFGEDGELVQKTSDGCYALSEDAVFTVVSRQGFSLTYGGETCESWDAGGYQVATGLFVRDACVSMVDGARYSFAGVGATQVLELEFDGARQLVRCDGVAPLAVGLGGVALYGVGGGIIEVLTGGVVSKTIPVSGEDILPVAELGLPENKAAEIRVRLKRDGSVVAATEFFWWPGLRSYDGSLLPGLPVNVVQAECTGVTFEDGDCVFDFDDPASHVQIALFGVRRPLRLAKRGVHVALRRGSEVEWIRKGQTVVYRRGDLDGRLRVTVFGVTGQLDLYGIRRQALGNGRSWHDIPLQDALASVEERPDNNVRWNSHGGPSIVLFRLVKGDPVIRWDETDALVKTETFEADGTQGSVLLAHATALDVADVDAFDRLGADGVRECEFLSAGPSADDTHVSSFTVDLRRLPSRARAWRLEYRLARPGEAWEDAKELGAPRYYLRHSRDLGLALPTDADYEHFCAACADVDGAPRLGELLQEATVGLSSPDRLVGGFAASLDTWRGPSPFDVAPELLARASWPAVCRAVVGPWLFQENEEYDPSAFLGRLSGGLASVLQLPAHDLYSEIFGYLGEGRHGKRRPAQPYPRDLIKSEHHLWACQQAITRLHRWGRQGFEAKLINAVARKMAQATSRVHFNPGKLTRFRDDIERELASNLSPAIFAFLWCTRGTGLPLSGRRAASSIWIESMRTSPHDLGLLVRLAPELVAFHLVLVENLAGTQEKAVA